MFISCVYGAEGKGDGEILVNKIYIRVVDGLRIYLYN
jgi:hypothetical protein